MSSRKSKVPKVKPKAKISALFNTFAQVWEEHNVAVHLEMLDLEARDRVEF